MRTRSFVSSLSLDDEAAESLRLAAPPIERSASAFDESESTLPMRAQSQLSQASTTLRDGQLSDDGGGEGSRGHSRSSVAEKRPLAEQQEQERKQRRRIIADDDEVSQALSEWKEVKGPPARPRTPSVNRGESATEEEAAAARERESFSRTAEMLAGE